MPDANDRIPPVAYSLSTEQWERIFGAHEKCGCEHPLDCEDREGCEIPDILTGARVEFH